MPVSNSTFRWTEAYRVNIVALDQQHAQLFDTVNELDQALRGGAENAAIDSVLHKLVGYALTHFSAEESLMRQHDFPGLLTHCSQHQMFRARIAEFLEEHRAGKAGVPVSLMLFMQSWLKEHLLNTDQQYSAFLNARGVH